MARPECWRVTSFRATSDEAQRATRHDWRMLLFPLRSPRLGDQKKAERKRADTRKRP